MRLQRNQSLRLWGSAIMGLTWLCGASVTAKAQSGIHWTVLQWPSCVETRAVIEFELVALNSHMQPLACTFPPTLAGHLDVQGRRWPVVAEVDFMSVPRRTMIQPGCFAKQRYRFRPPPGVCGEARVNWEWSSLPTLYVNLEPVDNRDSREPSRWPRWMRDADPEAAGTSLTPDRFFKEHFFAYEPFYFLAGTESPNAKFQISFKYRVVNEEGFLAGRIPWLQGLHLAYTQTSLWDWNRESKPFFDSSYKPEVLWSWENLLSNRSSASWVRCDLQGGFQHESNGKAGADSRSLNLAYVGPTFIFGPPDGLQLKIQPRLWTYIGGLEENPDLPDYRGYGDLRLTLGWPRGLQLSAWGRMGHEGDRGSLQLDLTYPMMRLLSGSFSLYLHAQYFTGYGESLLDYDARSSMFRVGLSLFR
ncbi:MAG: phospholipase A [Verrucomicrobiota bacterium]|nr:phospholipase A [Limisphaera sp.]MDW8381056.1 phospholipase A [Verrucomicrobiota bacterium]